MLDPGSQTAINLKTLLDPTGVVLIKGENKKQFPPNPPPGLPHVGTKLGLSPPPPSCGSSESSSRGSHAESVSRPSPSSPTSLFSSKGSQKRSDAELSPPVDEPGGGSTPAAAPKARPWHFLGSTLRLPAHFLLDEWSAVWPDSLPRANPDTTEPIVNGLAVQKAERPRIAIQPPVSPGAQAGSAGNLGNSIAKPGTDFHSGDSMAVKPLSISEQVSEWVFGLGSQAARLASTHVFAIRGVAVPNGLQLVDGFNGARQHLVGWVLDAGSRGARLPTFADAALGKVRAAVQQTQQGAVTWAAKAGNLFSTPVLSPPAATQSKGPPEWSWATSVAPHLEGITLKSRELNSRMVVVLNNMAGPSEAFGMARSQLAQVLRPLGTLAQTLRIEAERRTTPVYLVVTDEVRGVRSSMKGPQSWGLPGVLNLGRYNPFTSDTHQFFNLWGRDTLPFAWVAGVLLLVCLLSVASLARR